MDVIFLREAGNHSPLVKIHALLQIRGAPGIKNIAAIIGQYVYERLFGIQHSKTNTEAKTALQDPLGSAPEKTISARFHEILRRSAPQDKFCRVKRDRI